MNAQTGSKLLTVVFAAALVLVLAGPLAAQESGPVYTIFMTAYEVKGATTLDKLAPPPADPVELSKGYGYKGPGQADRAAPQKWEVSSYMFNPAVVTVSQGGMVDLTVFVVNGDEHEAWITAPDGTMAVPKGKWTRGREYRMRFRADQSGTYQLVCSSHAPSMLATFLVLPR